MVNSKNQYIRPIEQAHHPSMTYDESSAHVGRLKQAVDFVVPVGTPIVAALEGIVVDIKQDSDVGGPDKSFDAHGNYIEIKHKNDEYSIYEHIKKEGSLVKVGQKVKTGQTIGYSGATGWLDKLGPHLHFAVCRYLSKDIEDYESMKINWKNNVEIK